MESQIKSMTSSTAKILRMNSFSIEDNPGSHQYLAVVDRPTPLLKYNENSRYNESSRYNDKGEERDKCATYNKHVSIATKDRNTLKNIFFTLDVQMNLNFNISEIELDKRYIKSLQSMAVIYYTYNEKRRKAKLKGETLEEGTPE